MVDNYDSRLIVLGWIPLHSTTFLRPSPKVPQSTLNNRYFRFNHIISNQSKVSACSATLIYDLRIYHSPFSNSIKILVTILPSSESNLLLTPETILRLSEIESALNKSHCTKVHKPTITWIRRKTNVFISYIHRKLHALLLRRLSFP